MKIIIFGVFIIALFIILLILYFKNRYDLSLERTISEKNNFPRISLKKEEKVSVDDITYTINSDQKISIDNSHGAIRKIIRKYDKINSLEVAKESIEETINTQNETTNEILEDDLENEIDISGSAFFEDFEINEEEYPKLSELENIKEINNNNNELFKDIDNAVQLKIKKELELSISGDDDDDDLLNDFYAFKLEHSIIEDVEPNISDESVKPIEPTTIDKESNNLTTNNLNSSYNDNILSLFDENNNDVINKEINEINTDNKKNTINFTENKKVVNDNILNFDNSEFINLDNE